MPLPHKACACQRSVQPETLAVIGARDAAARAARRPGERRAPVAAGIDEVHFSQPSGCRTTSAGTPPSSAVTSAPGPQHLAS